MDKQTRLYWLHALTPLHVGAGRGMGYIDLPIMREKVTNWPLVPGSAVKGVLRDWHEQKRTAYRELAFGQAGHEHSNSGSLVLTDARIVCLPVRSLYGTFAWCTSLLALQRLTRDLEATGTSSGAGNIAPLGENEARTPAGGATKLKGSESKIYLEDLDLVANEDQNAGTWATWFSNQLFTDDGWRNAFKQRFAILPDTVFDFLCETGTEVAARVRIEDDTKTVADGALWYEESLPAETIMGGIVWCDKVYGKNGTPRPEPEELLQVYCDGELSVQIGGKGTVGHGRVRCIFAKGGQ